MEDEDHFSRNFLLETLDFFFSMSKFSPCVLYYISSPQKEISRV